MKIILIRAVVGTALICLVFFLTMLLANAFGGWLASESVYTSAVLLLPLSTVLRLGFRWGIWDFVAMLVLAEVLLVFGLRGNPELATCSALLVAPVACGLLIAVAVNAWVRRSRSHSTQLGAAPNGGPATPLGNTSVPEGPPSVS